MFDRALEAWVVEGDAPGPAGVASWRVPGFLWVVDCIDPTRLVRCEVDGGRQGSRPAARLDLVRTLLGPRAELQMGSSPARSLPAPADPGTLPARRSAGWLAVARDELRDGEPGDTLLACDMLLLSRRVGVEGVLERAVAVDDVADALDDLDEWLVPLLDEAEPTAARLLEPARAMVRAAGGKTSADPTTPADVACELRDLTSGRRAVTEAASSDLDHALLCQGLPAGAVTDARAVLGRSGHTVEATVRLGDRPAQALHLHAVELDGNQVRTRDSVPLVPGSRPGTLRGEVRWTGSGANALLVSDAMAATPDWVDETSEAVHWGREAVRAARRAEGALAVELWATCARWWRYVGYPRLAEQAGLQATGGLRASPFLRERRSARLTVEQELGRPRPGGGPPPGGVRRSGLAAADLLGYVDLASAARMELAETAFRDGHHFAAMVDAARCRRDFARCGNGREAERAARLHRQAEERWA